VEIDLAVGFRCTDDYLVKQQQGSFFSQILWSDQLLAWSKYYLIEHSSTAIAAGAWKQKLQAYAEQVIFVLLSSSLSFCWFIPMTWYSFGVDYFCWCHSAKKDVMRFLIYCSDVILLKNCIRQFLLIGSVQLLHGFYIRRRWEFSSLIFCFSPQSRPLEDCYQKRKRLLDFQVGSTPAENWLGLLAALHLQHANTVYSSKKLAVRSSLL